MYTVDNQCGENSISGHGSKRLDQLQEFALFPGYLRIGLRGVLPLARVTSGPDRAIQGGDEQCRGNMNRLCTRFFRV